MSDTVMDAMTGSAFGGPGITLPPEGGWKGHSQKVRTTVGNLSRWDRGDR